MDNIIECLDIGYKWNEEILFSHLDWSIKKGSFITLLGKSGSGKTTLLKIITGLIKTENKIKIDGLYLREKNLLAIRSKIGFVFENPEINIIADIVRDDILYSAPNNQVNENLEKKLEEIAKFLEISDLLYKNTAHLSGGEKQLVAIAGALVHGAKILILDNSFSMLDNVSKVKILKKLRRLNREKKITIIHVTTDIEDSLYGNYIALLGNQKIKFYGKNNQAFEEENIFLEEGIEMPFMVQLSHKLKYYGLVDKVFLDMNKMVDEVWK